MAEPVARFRGRVECRRAAAPLGLTLIGVSADSAGEPLALAFSGAAPAQLPATLEDAVVEPLGAGRYLIRAAAREWPIEARALHRHEDVGARFFAALPPRPVPLAKRLLWRSVLALAASRGGLALLRAMRR
jgi:hypothetical protein